MTRRHGVFTQDLMEMLKVSCIRCGGEHFVWECNRPVPDSGQIDQIVQNSEQTAPKWDKVAYQREYMRKRRAAAKADGRPA
jgi:hypothetical protein